MILDRFFLKYEGGGGQIVQIDFVVIPSYIELPWYYWNKAK